MNINLSEIYVWKEGTPNWPYQLLPLPTTSRIYAVLPLSPPSNPLLSLLRWCDRQSVEPLEACQRDYPNYLRLWHR